MEPEVVVVLLTVGLLCIVGASLLSGAVRLAAPLLLVVVGSVVSFLPGVPLLEIEPEWVLIGILPPLLYASAVSMPTMSFRRELRSITGLSVVLVLVSALALGWFFSAVLDVSFAWGVALGAIVSPTDAVATAIARRVGVPGRVLTMLEGESLLNDATALVLLRSAVAAGAGSIALGGVALSFLWALGLAVVIGFAVGWLLLLARSRVADPTVSTVLSYAAPFLAAVPAEQLEASGLVAAVVAGMVTGYGAPRLLSPRARLSDTQNWKTVELVLESGIFLLMGLQLHGLLTHSTHGDGTLVLVSWVAGVGLLLTLLIRAGYVTTLIIGQRRRTKRFLGMEERRAAIQDYIEQRIADPHLELDPPQVDDHRPGGRGPRGPLRPWAARRAQQRQDRRRTLRAWSADRLEMFQTRLRRQRADLDYLLNQPLGPREGGLLVWAGMRGAVSLAAAQTLPSDTPGRAALVLVAYFLAGGSLLIQGASLPLVVGWLRRPDSPEDATAEADERARVIDLLHQVSERERTAEQGRSMKQLRLDVLAAQRAALLDARDDGVFNADVLSHALAVVDAAQIGLELRGGPDG